MKTIQADAAKIMMLTRGMTRKDLSKMTGLKVNTITCVLNDHCQNRVARARIEWALNQSFWTTSDEFRNRKLLAKILGNDPVQMRLVDIRRKAFEMGYSGINRKRKAELITFLTEKISSIAEKLECRKSDRKDSSRDNIEKRNNNKVERNPGEVSEVSQADREAESSHP